MPETTHPDARQIIGNVVKAIVADAEKHMPDIPLSDSATTDSSPVSNLGQTVTFPGQSVSSIDPKNDTKPHSRSENADSASPEKNVGQMGHSDDSEMSDELRKLHEAHPKHKSDISAFFDISDLQLRAIDMLVSGNSDSEIARTLHIGRRTLWRWKNFNDAFRQFMEKARLERFAVLGLRHQMAVDHAASVLDKILDDATSETNRIRAAQILIRMFAALRPRK